MEIETLNNIIDDENNEKLMDLTTSKINEINLNILRELNLDNKTLNSYFNKLEGYRYIDEIDELKYGAFIRWIPLINPNNLPLNYCGIICDIKFNDKGTYIVCKNFMHRIYQIKMEQCLIFQKLSDQELILLNMLDYLEKEKEK
jgi:hypothetical protein